MEEILEKFLKETFPYLTYHSNKSYHSGMHKPATYHISLIFTLDGPPSSYNADNPLLEMEIEIQYRDDSTEITLWKFGGHIDFELADPEFYSKMEKEIKEILDRRLEQYSRILATAQKKVKETQELARNKNGRIQ